MNTIEIGKINWFSIFWPRQCPLALNQCKTSPCMPGLGHCSLCQQHSDLWNVACKIYRRTAIENKDMFQFTTSYKHYQGKFYTGIYEVSRTTERSNKATINSIIRLYLFSIIVTLLRSPFSTELKLPPPLRFLFLRGGWGGGGIGTC